MVASFFIGFFGSILISNMTRALINVLLARRFIKSSRCLTKLLIAEEA
jgi:hypothetical protein